MSNIAFLDRDPALIARYHVDRLLAREVLDVARVLQAAHIMCDGEPSARARTGNAISVSRPYMQTVSARWARDTSQNYLWTSRLFAALVHEYELRNGQPHRFDYMARVFENRPMLIKMGEMTEFPQAGIPERFHREDVIFSHRLCYFWMPAGMANWSPPAKTPEWWKDMQRAHEHNRRDLSGVARS